MRRGPRAGRLLPAAFFLSFSAACRTAPASPAPEPAAIRLKGDPEFQERGRAALALLRATRTGSALLRRLSRTGRRVTVRPGSQDLAGAVTQPVGDGDSLILWDPEHVLEGFPPHVVLYHELVHALHEARGERLAEGEEEKASGVGAFADYPLSENALRRELGLPLRTSTDGTGFD